MTCGSPRRSASMSPANRKGYRMPGPRRVRRRPTAASHSTSPAARSKRLTMARGTPRRSRSRPSTASAIATGSSFADQGPVDLAQDLQALGVPRPFMLRARALDERAQSVRHRLEKASLVAREDAGPGGVGAEHAPGRIGASHDDGDAAHDAEVPDRPAPRRSPNCW